MRDWHAFGQLTLWPLLATLLLHGLLLAALLLRWQGERESRTIEARVLPPAIVEATLIDASSLRERTAPRARSTATRPAPDPAPAPAREAPPPPRRAAPATAAGSGSAEATGAAPETGDRGRAGAASGRGEPAGGAGGEPRRISAEELAAISRRELEAAIASEEAGQVAVTAEEMAASYAALIRDTVTGYWSRPPSARNGMQALLELQLVPTGEIVSVRVLESSGDVAFDRSAMNAVEKAGSFPELQNLPPREFNDTFRRFRLLFRPEDLRY